uniref:Uncharacterized protein n=1 Tax=Megaviridae environmental sample TaxID=1737588 RepID=A0A5J6VLK0_9VIRU|nr:MAG: hypothetical protein [Megaviridae environmental sample]
MINYNTFDTPNSDLTKFWIENKLVNCSKTSNSNDSNKSNKSTRVSKSSESNKSKKLVKNNKSY